MNVSVYFFVLGGMKSVKICSYHLSFLTVLASNLYVKGQVTEKYNQFVNVTRSNSTKCEQLNNNWKCPTLEKALNLSELSFTYINVFTTSENISSRIPIIGVDTLAIASANKALKTSINCSSSKKSKLSLINSSNIYMYGLSFESCGTNHSDDYIVINTSKIHLSSAIYLKNVTKLTVNDSIFTGSRGYGIVMVNVVNAVYYNTKVEANTLMQLLNLPYGGGIILVSSFKGRSSNNNVTFTNCIFSKNRAIQDVGRISKVKSSNDTKKDIFKEKIHGNGGSLSFYLWSEKVSLNLAIRNSIINESGALQGGGIYIEFGNLSKGNIVHICNSSLNGSYAQLSGAAMQIHKAKDSENNTIYIRGCMFWRNNAETLAGAFLQRNFGKPPKYGDWSVPETVIELCNFLENKGMLGSALYIESTALMLKSTNITNNTGSEPTNSISFGHTDSTLLRVGVLFAFESKVYMNDTMEVSGNFNTAFVLSCSYLFLQGRTIFKNNQGTEGGAISLYDESAIFLSDATYLHFKSNKAIVGGALYVHAPGPAISVWIFPELNLYKCFFQFSQTTKQAFKGKVIFEDNNATKNDGNAIFTNLLHTCQESRSDDLSNVLTGWPNFNFIGNPNSPINTVPVEIKVNKSDWDDIQPGMKFSVNITLLDERGQSVEGPIDISFEPEDLVYVKNSKIIVSGKRIDLEIFGMENIIFNITIKTPSGRAVPYRLINEKMKSCGFGFSFTSRTNSCTCVNIKNQDRMISRCVGKDVYLYKNVWAYPFQKTTSIDEETTQVCPHGYCNLTCNLEKDSRDCKYNYHYQCAKNRNQSFNNYLCAKCSTHHSVVLGSEECRDCRNSNNWWAALLILLAIPTLVVTILWVNVDIYRWLLNSLIFYYQVVYLLFIPQQYTNVFIGAFTGAVDSRDLGVDGTGFCLYDGFNNVSKIVFNFSIPFSMIVSLVIIIILTEKCPCTLPWERVNTFRAILFVLMLAYSDITRITLDILDFVVIDGEKRMVRFAVWKYLHGEHLYCAIPAFIILIVFVIGVPFALIAPSVAMTFEGERCNRLIHSRFYISFIKPFLERFLSVFNKNLKCHLFISFYFFFRLILLLIVTFLKRDQLQLTLMTSFCFMMFLIFSIVRPYQNDMYNYFDIFILFNLTVIGFLSHGKLKLFFWDHKIIYIDWAIRVLLWVPLITWVVALIMLYRGDIRNRFFATWVRFRDRRANIDES